MWVYVGEKCGCTRLFRWGIWMRLGAICGCFELFTSHVWVYSMTKMGCAAVLRLEIIVVYSWEMYVCLG